MQVIVPFATSASMLPAVRLALRQDGWEADYRHMREQTSYYDLLVEMWAKGRTFCVVEHDIVCPPGALTELANCPEGWCTRPYYCSMGWILDGLGCAKFSEDFIAAHPGFLEPPFPTCCKHTTYYCGLDRLIAHRCSDLGIKPHVHEPGVVNLNDKFTI